MFNMGGGPGIRVHQFGGGRPRRRPAGAANNDGEPPNLLKSLSSLLPIILIFVFPLISSIFSNLFGGGSGASYPDVRMDGPKPPQTFARVSTGLKIPYWVSPVDTAEYAARDWRNLDNRIETQYVQNLQYRCQHERDQQQRIVNEAVGFFFTDNKKLAEARNMDMPACSRLNQLGYAGRP